MLETHPILALLLLALLGPGCAGDPEAKSGADAYRHEAAPLPMDEWVTDDASEGDGDATDWKSVDVEGGGRLLVQLAADDASSEIELAVFDRYGEPLGKALREEGGDRVQVEVPGVSGGRYFVRVRSTDGPGTTYMIRATLGAGDDGAPTGPRPDF